MTISEVYSSAYQYWSQLTVITVTKSEKREPPGTEALPAMSKIM